MLQDDSAAAQTGSQCGRPPWSNRPRRDNMSIRLLVSGFWLPAPHGMRMTGPVSTGPRRRTRGSGRADRAAVTALPERSGCSSEGQNGWFPGWRRLLALTGPGT